MFTNLRELSIFAVFLENTVNLVHQIVITETLNLLINVSWCVTGFDWLMVCM